MLIDLQTLLLASGTVVSVAAFSFILNTVLRGADDVGRTWSLSFIAGILTTLSYAVWGVVPDAWWAIAVGNGALALTLGTMWSGSRQFNERASMLWIPNVTSVLVAVAVLVWSTGVSDGYPALDPYLVFTIARKSIGAAIVVAGAAVVAWQVGRLGRDYSDRSTATTLPSTSA